MGLKKKNKVCCKMSYTFSVSSVFIKGKALMKRGSNLNCTTACHKIVLFCNQSLYTRIPGNYGRLLAAPGHGPDVFIVNWFTGLTGTTHATGATVLLVILILSILPFDPSILPKA